MASLNVFAQETRVLTGTLKDDNGDPLPGVNIVIKGTTTGITTDYNGYYSIEAPVGSTLVFNFVGYATREVYVAPANNSKKEKDKAKTAILPAPSDTTPPPAPPKVFKHTIPNSTDKTLSPYFFVQSDNPAVDRMPLKSTTASVNISGVIADVKVKQLYVNEGKNTLEAIYIFPGSTKAAVYGMTMKIGERLLKAKIKEKQQARTEYEAAKKEGKTATLLEQNRPNVFQMNVANILPGDSIEVELSYTELIESLNGVYEFVYPTVVGPRYSETADTPENASEQWVQNPYLHQGENPPYTFDLKLNINTGIPIQKIYSPSHETNIIYNDKDKATVSLNENDKSGGNRDFILRYGLRGGKVESGILLHENGDENFFVLMMEPPATPAIEDIPPREYIFIMDVSGSMSGFPLDISKSIMTELLGHLRETDKFNILTFAGGSNLMWNHSKPATSENIRLAAKFTDMQSGGGGTRLLDALEKALNLDREEGYSRSFVVMTDGYVDVEKESFNLVRSNLGKANLFALGIGSSTNRYLIEGLAHAGMGEQFIATTPEEGRSVGKRLIEYIEQPVLTGITVDFGDFKAYDYEPSAIPDMFAKRPILIYGKYTGNAEGVIKVRGITGTTPYVKTFNLKDASKENNEALRYLWARNKVRYWDDYAQYYTHPSQYDTKPEKTSDEIQMITQLGLKYNILTQYTSFIAVDSLIRNKSQEITTVKQPVPLPKGVSDKAVGKNFGSVQTSSTSESDLDISLSAEIMSLEEVVVTGYGTVKKSDLTSSVTSIRSERFTGSGSLSNALQGQAAGVQITNNSGAPGSGSTIYIRGQNSLMGNQQPLYVIDGIPLAVNEDPSVNPLGNIDPSAISSVEILKDASATAIYGSRGASGVIIINTKKGTSGKPKITLNSGLGVASVSATTSSLDNNSYWYDPLTRNGFIKDLQLGIQARNQKFQYLTNLGIHDETGVLHGSDIRKYNGNADYKWNLFKGKVETGFSGIAGYSVMHDFLRLSPDQNNNNIPLKRKYYNLNGKAFVNIELPVKGLKFKNEITGSESNKHILLDELQTPISFQNLMNDNVKLSNFGTNSGFEYSGSFNYINTINAQAFYEFTSIQNQYNYHPDRGLSDNYPVEPLTQKFSINSVVARINYGFRDKYVVTSTLRRDISQRFLTNKKGITLPSLAVGWNVSNEPFLQNSRFLSNLKLKYSLGLTGNCQFPFYPLTSLITEMGGADVPSIAENNQLGWEKTNKQNLGLEIGLLNSRLSFTIDLFRNKTTNMYYLSAIDVQNRYYQWLNAGDFTNRGIDFSVNGLIFNDNDFRIKATANISMNRTRITRVTAENQGVHFETVHGIVAGQTLKVGDPIGVYYGLKIKNVDKANQFIEYEDVTKDGTVDQNDYQQIANINPKFYGGAGLQISFRNLEWNTFFNFVSGNQVINADKNLDKYNFYTSNKFIAEPVLTSLSVEDGSYLRLSEVSLAYNVSQNLARKLRMDHIKIILAASNLLTFTGYSGQDPEFNNYYYKEREMAKVLPGIDRNFYPVSKSFQLKLEIGF